MNEVEIQQFLVDFFTTNDCLILENSMGRIVVQLSKEIDQKIMNRSFYWYYLEKIGKEPELSTLTLVTNVNKAKNKGDEYIHYGSPLLQKIFGVCQESGQYIRLYENCQNALYPWLNMNILVSFLCNLERSIFLSFGLNLLNGSMVFGFAGKVSHFILTPKIPDLSYTLFPFITMESGIKRILRLTEEFIKQETQLTAWDVEAYKRLNADLRLLDCFYDGVEKGEEYHQEKSAIYKLYEPRVHVKVVSGGLFYLAQKELK